MVTDVGLVQSNHAIMSQTAFMATSGHWKGHTASEKGLEEERKLPVE